MNIANEHGNTPLHYACFWSYEEICRVSDIKENWLNFYNCLKNGKGFLIGFPIELRAIGGMAHHAKVKVTFFCKPVPNLDHLTTTGM